MDESKDIYYRINNSGLGEIDIRAISSWDGFDIIVDYLKQIYSAEILDIFDGIWSRHCNLMINNMPFKIEHDDMFGNQLISLHESGNIFLKDVYHDMKSRVEKNN